LARIIGPIFTVYKTVPVPPFNAAVPVEPP